MKLGDIEDCSECPLKDKELCPGGWTSGAGGIPIEPPCAGWDGEEDVDDYISSVRANIIANEEYEDRLWKEKQEKQRKNEITKRKRRYINSYCISERLAVESLKKQIKSYEDVERFASSLAAAFNITNEMFRYPERKEVNPAIMEKLQTLKEELKKAEQNLKDKQKECRDTEYYKNIGKET